MHPNESYFIILLCLMPDNLTHHKESAATQWVNQQVMFNPLLKLQCTQMSPTLLFYSV
jgi:hypothetical protein